MMWTTRPNTFLHAASEKRIHNNAPERDNPTEPPAQHQHPSNKGGSEAGWAPDKLEPTMVTDHKWAQSVVLQICQAAAQGVSDQQTSEKKAKNLPRDERRQTQTNAMEFRRKRCVVR